MRCGNPNKERTIVMTGGPSCYLCNKERARKGKRVPFLCCPLLNLPAAPIPASLLRKYHFQHALHMARLSYTCIQSKESFHLKFLAEQYPNPTLSKQIEQVQTIM